MCHNMYGCFGGRNAPNIENALTYLGTAKTLNQPGMYEPFLTLLRDYKTDESVDQT